MIVFYHGSIYLFLLVKTVFALTNYCITDVQDSLQYGVSNSMSDPCCTKNGTTVNYFETIGLFQQLNSSGITTLYDSTCGLPLFNAPIGRTFEEWKDECEMSGELLFHEKEAICDNLRVLKSGELVSICGTRLGEYIASSSGDYYSVNIACLSGLPIEGVTTSSVLNGSAFNPGSLIDPGNATSLVGVILLGSLGGILVLLTSASCYRWWMRKRAQYWCNESGPLKLLFLEDETVSPKSVEPDYPFTIPSPNRVCYDEIPAAGMFASREDINERQEVHEVDYTDVMEETTRADSNKESG